MTILWLARVEPGVDRVRLVGRQLSTNPITFYPYPSFTHPIHALSYLLIHLLLSSPPTFTTGNASNSADGSDDAMLTENPFLEPLSGYNQEPMVLTRGVSLPVSQAGTINAAIAAASHTQDRRLYVVGIYEKTGPPLKAGAMLLSTAMGGIAVRICEQSAVGNLDKSNSAVLHLNPTDLYKLCKAQNR